MSDGYLSRDAAHLAELQRKRRARMVRIDYMPGKEAAAIIEHRRQLERPESHAATNSAILDAIVREWAAATGTKYREVDPPMTSANRHQYAQARMTPEADHSARAQESGDATGIAGRFAGVRAGAYDFDGQASSGVSEILVPQPRRVVCGAKRHRDGGACQAMSEPGKRRCRFHGGKSTGPTTDQGRARSRANLRQNAKGQV